VNPLQLTSASRVTIVAGKGGVGKTTVTAALARAAADSGQRVLAIELDGKPALAEVLHDEGDGVPVRAISAPTSLDEYLRDHGFARIAKRLNTTGVIDVVSTAAPGIDDIVVLGKIKQLERSGEWDAIVVDGPAAGHAITFLTSASGMLDAVRGGPLHTQATDVVELLRDPARSQVVLVTIPETTPVNEAIETAYALEDRVGVHLGPVVVNGVDPGIDAELPDPASVKVPRGAVGSALRAAARYRIERRAMQRAEIARLAEELAVPQIRLPMLTTAYLTSADVRELAGHLREQS
jgi:anion-transporting  ArsA/GET3 family ATPase